MDVDGILIRHIPTDLEEVRAENEELKEYKQKYLYLESEMQKELIVRTAQLSEARAENERLKGWIRDAGHQSDCDQGNGCLCKLSDLLKDKG